MYFVCKLWMRKLSFHPLLVVCPQPVPRPLFLVVPAEWGLVNKFQQISQRLVLCGFPCRPLDSDAIKKRWNVRANAATCDATAPIKLFYGNVFFRIPIRSWIFKKLTRNLWNVVIDRKRWRTFCRGFLHFQAAMRAFYC